MAIIEQIAELAARHKLIPFLGAGSSYELLQVDWDSVRDNLASKIGIVSSDHGEVAERFVEEKGEEAFCKELHQALTIEEFDDRLGSTHLCVMSMNLGLVYTTNQDNVWEKCCEKYGRYYRKIVSISDIAEHRPGDSLYMKYHGDLDTPESIVFTKSSYSRRIEDPDHFLNIRLKSDALGKAFLFIGYSFRDQNIQLIFENLNKLFRGKLPPSYLIAFSYSRELESITEQYGIQIVDPVKVTGETDKTMAFNALMSNLCSEIFSRKMTSEIHDMFHPKTPSSQRVVTTFELQGVSQKLQQDSTSSVALFRATFDGALVPKSFHDHVSKLFVDLAKKCTTSDLISELTGSAFNLYLQPAYAFEVRSALLALAQFRGTKGALDVFNPRVHNINRPMEILSVARAIDLLAEWNVPITDEFRKHCTGWVEGFWNLPPDAIEYLSNRLSHAWKSHTTYEHPMNYWKRLKYKTSFGSENTFENHRDQIHSLIPKSFIKPHET